MGFGVWGFGVLGFWGFGVLGFWGLGFGVWGLGFGVWGLGGGGGGGKGLGFRDSRVLRELRCSFGSLPSSLWEVFCLRALGVRASGRLRAPEGERLYRLGFRV